MSDTHAYCVTDADDSASVVVFSKLAVTARQRGANQLGIDFEEVGSCTRVKEFDQYAPGPVPISAYLEQGWWWECGHCGFTFTDEGLQSEDSDSVWPESQPFEPVTDKDGSAYCCMACMMAEYAEVQGDLAKVHAAIEAAQIHWPMASNIQAQMVRKPSTERQQPVRGQDAKSGRVPYQPDPLSAHADYSVEITMSLPQLKYPCSWFVGDMTMSVTASESQLFQSLYGIKKLPTQGLDS